MKTITSMLVALAITFGASVSHARPLIPGELMVVYIFCGNIGDLEKLARGVATENFDIVNELLKNKDVKCFSSQLGHFPVIQGAEFVQYLGVDIMTISRIKLYGVEAYWQNMTLYFFVGENFAPPTEI